MNIFFTILTVACALGMGTLYYFMELGKNAPARMTPGDDKAFRMPDMRPRYTGAELCELLEAVGDEGHGRMRRYWRLDFGFIACFWVVMLAVTRNLVPPASWIYLPMLIAATLRGLLDLLENLLLLRLTARWPEKHAGLASLTGWVTTFKFAALGVWVVLMFLQLFLVAIQY